MADRDRELLDAVLDRFYELLTRPAVDDVTALSEAEKICGELQGRFGGRAHYWPKPDKVPRDARIASELRATSDPRTVAAKHKLHPDTVTRIARKMKNGNGGFGNDDWNL